jgi:hypothetical protein
VLLSVAAREIEIRGFLSLQVHSIFLPAPSY